MKKALTLAVLAAAFGSAQADTYKVDSHHTNARFAIDHFNTSTNTGGFYNLSGTVGMYQDVPRTPVVIRQVRVLSQ